MTKKGCNIFPISLILTFCFASFPQCFINIISESNNNNLSLQSTGLNNSLTILTRLFVWKVLSMKGAEEASISADLVTVRLEIINQ